MAHLLWHGETNSILKVKEAEPITKHDVITPQANYAGQPRARGEVRLSSKEVGTQSVLDCLYQSGSARCLFPRSANVTLNTVILNTSGGLTGGDKMRVTVTAGVNSTLTLTTQACERAYKAQPDQVAQVCNSLNVENGARLNWMPQETILFEGSALHRRLRVNMDGNARLLMVEPVVFGRAAMGEQLHNCQFRDRIKIMRDGRLDYIDSINLTGDVSAHLTLSNVAGGAGAMASVILVDPLAETHLDDLRALLPDTAGASLLAKDVLVLRLLAPDSFTLRKVLVPVLRLLNDTEIPRCWMI